VSGQWSECLSQYTPTFRGRSERELMIATAELRRRHARHSGRFNITALKLAQFLESVESEEVLLQQRVADREARNILHITNGGLKTQAHEIIDHPSSMPDQPSNTESPIYTLSDRSDNIAGLEMYEEL
jgi:type II secretory pathway component PulK